MANEIQTIRVSEELFNIFREMTVQKKISQADMFKELLLKYGASKQGERIFGLQQAHSQLINTCSLLENQLFEVFQKYDTAISDMENEQNDYLKLQAENKKLYSLVLDLQTLVKEKDSEIADQKAMLEYLTEEMEKLQSKGSK